MIRTYLSDLFSLFYPELCAACGNTLYRNEQVICSYCSYHLPYTDFHLDPENKLRRQFHGRIQIESAAAFLYFKKAGRVQHLLHELKYKGRQEVGTRMGELCAARLKESEFFSGIDLIVPVPLHKKKLRKRGFNQAALFAKGLSEKNNCHYDPEFLVRLIDNPTQTKRARYDRFENVEQIFALNKNKSVQGMHVLLVDDVVTTGSTLEACAEVLIQAGAKVSLLTLAYSAKQ